jgi:hypothetical protein
VCWFVCFVRIAQKFDFNATGLRRHGNTLFRCLILFGIQRRIVFVLANYPCERSLLRGRRGGGRIIKKASHFKVLGARRVTISKFRPEDPEILGGTVQSIVATTTWHLGFVHPWFRAVYAAAVAHVLNLLFSPIYFLNQSLVTVHISHY